MTLAIISKRLAKLWDNSDVDNDDDPSSCWIWQGRLDKYGYPQVKWGGKKSNRLVHRLMYELYVGSIPPGMTVDHVCHNNDPSCKGGIECRHRRCVNPEHLALATNHENILRGKLLLANRDRCQSGRHDITKPGALVIVNRAKGYVTCRECQREGAARHRQRKRERSMVA